MVRKTRMAGLVLAGGRSSRFGREKAVEVLGGRTLLAWSLAALAGQCDRVAVSAPRGGGAAALAEHLGLAVLEDDPDHARGPLAGLAAGLAWARGLGFDRLATLPCDTPRVTADHVAALATAMGGGSAAFAVTEEGSHGLCAIWRADLGEALAARLRSRDHPAVGAFLSEIKAKSVRFADAADFANLNTAEDIARFTHN